VATPRFDEDALNAAVIGLARSFGRYGYRRTTDLLQMAGWQVNAKRVERIWRAEGLKVPKRQPKGRRLWLADGSCIRLRPEHANHVWAYDFVSETMNRAVTPRSSSHGRTAASTNPGPSSERVYSGMP
jgi:putative transposase